MIAASILPATPAPAAARDAGRLANSAPGFRRDLSQAFGKTRPDPAPVDHSDDTPIETDEADQEQREETTGAQLAEASPQGAAGADRQQPQAKEADPGRATVTDTAKAKPQSDGEAPKLSLTGANDEASVLLTGSDSQSGAQTGKEPGEHSGGGGDPLKMLAQVAALKAGSAAAMMPPTPTADASAAQVAALTPTAAPPAASSVLNAAGAAPPGAAFEAEQSGVDPNVARVARGLQSALNQQGGSVALRLHPPELGMVRLEMEIDGSTVRARLTAEHESVRTLLNQQLNHLRQALRGQGLIVERLEVQTQPPASGSEAEPQSWQDHTDDGRSRGRHSFFKQDSDGQATNDRSATDPINFEQVLLNTVG
jgi:hypothetical protein